MKERIHEQISGELKQANKSDLVTIIIAIIVTFMLFGMAIGSAYASVSINFMGLSGRVPEVSALATIIMFVSIAAIIMINLYAVRALLQNKSRRAKLNEGLMKLYKDEGMDQYYDGSIFKSYETRYNTYAVIVGTVGALSVIVPLAVFINQLVNNL
ncbi:MAG: hypothetical protein A2Z15_00925 [Chloroflexi bacterium RBG_16_50_11]|nr:MAG: hypothetical protein A2Z15_00925 [Chloroflexi bacterium RBG_16_50_11]